MMKKKTSTILVLLLTIACVAFLSYAIPNWDQIQMNQILSLLFVFVVAGGVTAFILCGTIIFFIHILMDVVFAFSISDALVYDFYSCSLKRFGMIDFLMKYDPIQQDFAVQEFHKVLKKHPYWGKIYRVFAETDATELLEGRNYGDEK